MTPRDGERVYQPQMDADERRFIFMTERAYMDVRDLNAVRHASQILRHIYPTPASPNIQPAEHKTVLRILDEWEARLAEAVEKHLESAVCKQ